MKYWNILCKKNKIFKWIDNKILWYLIYKPYYTYREIRGWFMYNFNKAHYNLVKCAFYTYPFDGEYLDDIVYYKLCEQYEYFSKRPPYCSVEKLDDVIMWLSIAKNLAYIITHDSELWDAEGEISFNGDNSKDTYHSWSKVYVNMKNKERFAYRYIDYQNNNKIGHSTQMYDNSPWELYKEKARRLLYRIITEKGLEWWD